MKKKLQIEGWGARLLQIQTKYFAAQSRTCSKMQGSAGVWGSKDPVDRKWIAIWWEPTRKLTSHDGSYIFSFILGGDVFLYLAHNVYFRAGGVDWVHRDLWKRVLWAALQKVRVKILVVLWPKTYKNIPISTTTNYMIMNPGTLLTGLLKHETTDAGVPTPRSSCPPASPPPLDLRNFKEALTSSLPPPQATPWSAQRHHLQETRSHRTTASRREVDEARMLGLTTCPRLSQPLATRSQRSTASTTSSGKTVEGTNLVKFWSVNKSQLFSDRKTLEREVAWGWGSTTAMAAGGSQTKKFLWQI